VLDAERIFAQRGAVPQISGAPLSC
jgi:hypothetical protein